MPQKRANVKNEKQYERLKKKGMSKARAAKIANTPDASKKGGKSSGFVEVEEVERSRLRWQHLAESQGRPQGREGDRAEAELN